MIGTYDYGLVAISYLVASLASYVALDMAGRITASQGSTSRWWLFAGGTAMGVGIWSMHFIGMLAFTLPIPQGYDLAITLYSLLIAIAASTYALWLVSQPTLPHRRLLGGALVLGAGIAAMHYTGMAAMRMVPGIDYDPWWFTLSIVVAIASAGAALWIAHHLRSEGRRIHRIRALAALVMGLAVAGMHYIGMAAARFPAGSYCGAALGHGVSSQWLACLVGVSSFAILGMAIVVSLLDRRMQERTTELSLSLQQANDKLTYLALHDPLTVLPNRFLLEDRLNQAVEKALRSTSRLALLIMDLDGFKSINDAYGHPVGDRLLVHVAAGIREVARAQDTVARLGGDEFVLLMEVDGPDDAALMADKLLRQARVPLDLGHGLVQVSASIGIALFPDDSSSARELLAYADAAMYHVKDQGRNAYGFFKASMNLGAQEHLALIQDLRKALAQNQLMLHFQPKLKAPEGPLLGVEALLRWQHPQRGLIMPDVFIPLAERNGLIIEIGDWVLDEACRQLAVWHREGHEIPSMAVNLSATQFRYAGLTGRVRDTLRRHGIAPGALTLEVTESTAMHDPEASLLILQELVDIGVHISIDDFGTGYSSLMYLKKLPASELKIDRGFIKDLLEGSEDEAIVTAIIALGKTLNLNIIAEGVETRQQQLLLTQLGCTALQGFHLGRPVGADQLVLDWDSAGNNAESRAAQKKHD
ncbi:MAG: EAL domain-containing protein [Xanthomonadaceae bacterium]|nr:EAL domain-containing protein [Xanthomonadaceae bacterium]MDE2249328.1 EAL domain-containing protein [Xanthomonadaceae bacterium]